VQVPMLRGTTAAVAVAVVVVAVPLQCWGRYAWVGGGEGCMPRLRHGARVLNEREDERMTLQTLLKLLKLKCNTTNYCKQPCLL
jgi:cytochrome c-type biogenesis protein CcmH/NrfG